MKKIGKGIDTFRCLNLPCYVFLT